jgi:hypothetical protein
MWGMIVATIATFYPVIGAWALGLLIPYLAWVSYASALTIWIWRNNPAKVGAGRFFDRKGSGGAGQLGTKMHGAYV